MKVATAGLQAAHQLIGVVQALGDDMLDAIFAFDSPIDNQQSGFQQNSALAFGEVSPDHDIDHAVFVFQGEEGDAAGR